MQEQRFVKVFRTAKIIQLCLLMGIELTFFLILTYNTDLSRQIYASKPLFTLCAITWIMMLFNLLCLLYDFAKLRSFASESHALKKAAYLDNLTGIPNRYSLDVFSQNYTSIESLAGLGCAMYTIDNLKEINDSLGHQTGDSIIRDFCILLEETGDSFGFIGRNSGNQFIALFDNCNVDVMNRFSDTLDRRVSIYNADHPQTPIRLKSAVTICAEEPVQTFTQLLTLTYNKLYDLS